MRFGARNVLVPGLVLIAAGLACSRRSRSTAPTSSTCCRRCLLFGIGGGTAFPALMTLAMSGVEPQDAGLASGLVNTTAQVGGALGLAVLATLSATRTDTLTEQGKSTAEALTGGYQLAFVVALGLALAALVVAVTVIKPVAPEPHGAPVADEDVRRARSPTPRSASRTTEPVNNRPKRPSMLLGSCGFLRSPWVGKTDVER